MDGKALRKMYGHVRHPFEFLRKIKNLTHGFIHGPLRFLRFELDLSVCGQTLATVSRITYSV